jgi:hypothetical protein
MKIWQVTIIGEGFLRQNTKMGFELGGFILAADPQSAFDKAIDLAVQDYPEIRQAENLEGKTPPIPVIKNMDTHTLIVKNM